MSKRATKFERSPGDFYPTPAKAVAPLLPYLNPRTRFYEPCAGDGSLVRALVDAGHICLGASDIEPQHMWISKFDILTLEACLTPSHDRCFITNPPWERDLLHKILERLPAILPTWLLIDADWLFTKQAAPYWPRATLIVAVGRVRFIPDSKHDGYDNTCWVRFEAKHLGGPRFVGRI